MHFELAAGFGTTPRLPKIAAATSIDDAAAVEVGDASDPAAPLPLPPPPRPGAVYLTTRPAKKKIAFVTGTPITAAVAREVAELRRAREEATELAAAFHGGQRPTAPITTQPAAPGGSSSSPRRKVSSGGAGDGGAQSQSARGPSPRRRAAQEAAAHASKSASLQGSVSKQLGLDGTAASLEPAPSERLGYSHEGPQPQQSPYVALHAKDAVLAHLTAPFGYDAWTSRSTQRGGPLAESLVNGREALVLAEVEKVAREAGLTLDAMVDSGLSIDEARALLERLYVHSTGFVQQLAEAFGRQPQREELLGKVWNAYGLLVERVKVSGVDYRSALAAHQKRAEAAYAQLEADFHATSKSLQAQLEEVRGQIAAYVGERDEQRARADASDALATARIEERALAETALQVVEKELKAEVQKRESVERRLAEEVKAQVPLKAQLSQLANVQAEAARFQLAAQKASAELPPLLEATKRLEQQVQQAEVISSVLREDKGVLEKEVSVASLKLDAKTREVEKLANELRIERNKMLEIQVVQVQAETKKESKLGGLLERLLMAEKEREAIEKRALAAEREVKQVKQEVQAALIAMDCH